MYWKTFTGFKDYHNTHSYLKTTFIEVWEKEKEVLEKTSYSKFRGNQDVNQYLFRYWQLVKGNFYPAKASKFINKRKHLELRSLEDCKIAASDIISGNYEMYCLNDATSKGRYTKETMNNKNFEESKALIIKALEQLLPKKSSFES